jgi:hypothetical protein
VPAPAPVSQVVDNEVVKFAQLFVQESLRQDDERRIGKDDIVLTGTACKP